MKNLWRNLLAFQHYIIRFYNHKCNSVFFFLQFYLKFLHVCLREWRIPQMFPIFANRYPINLLITISPPCSNTVIVNKINKSRIPVKADKPGIYDIDRCISYWHLEPKRFIAFKYLAIKNVYVSSCLFMNMNNKNINIPYLDWTAYAKYDRLSKNHETMHCWWWN